MIESRRPDIVVVLKKEKEYKIIDIAVLGDCRICEKETEKIVWRVKKGNPKIVDNEESRSDSNSNV